MKTNTAESAADAIVDIAYADSGVEVDRVVLEDLLRTDYGIVGRYPTAEECDLLVTGGDEGECPEELQDEFPQTYEFIGTYWE